MVRTPCCRAEGLKKGAWTPEEDELLVAYVNKHGEGGWRTLPEKAGLKRCGKSCRLRWANYLRPDIKRGDFSAEEEEAIINLHATHGNKWSAIARRLRGRTDNEIKNHWNTHIKKRLTKKGIDPMTHKPIFQNSDGGTETISENSGGEDYLQDNETKRKQYSSGSGSGSARLLNRVANRFGRRVNHSVLAQIIEGGGGSGGPRSNSDSNIYDNALLRTTSNCTTSTSKLLNKMAMVNTTCTNMLMKSIFENNNPASSASASASASASSSTFSDSSASMVYCLDTPTTDDLQGISSKTEHEETDDIFEFLNNMSNYGGLAEDHHQTGFENSGFMKELANILMNEDDMVAPLEFNEGVLSTNGGKICNRTFNEIESYLQDCMALEN